VAATGAPEGDDDEEDDADVAAAARATTPFAGEAADRTVDCAARVGLSLGNAIVLAGKVTTLSNPRSASGRASLALSSIVTAAGGGGSSAAPAGPSGRATSAV
jgi:hypothetical protein